MLVNQVVLGLGFTFKESRRGYPLAVPSPQFLKLLQLFSLFGELEILVHSSPCAVERTNDPAVR